MAGKHRKRTSIRSYTRSNGTKVRGHKRQVEWSDARKKAAVAGVGGLTFLFTAVEVGFEVATALLLVVGAIIGIVFTIANGGRGTKRGKAVARRLLTPQSKAGRKRNQTKGAFTCRRCKQKFSNPIGHVCRIRWSTANKKPATSRAGSGKSSTRRAA